MPSSFCLRNKLELSSAVYVLIQARASISFMALENQLQSENGVKMCPVFVYAVSLCQHILKLIGTLECYQQSTTSKYTVLGYERMQHRAGHGHGHVSVTAASSERVSAISIASTW